VATMPTLTQLRAHLNFNDPTDTSHDAEVSDMLAAAVEVLSHEPEFPLVSTALTDGQDHPALRLALMELVRDMWSGTQSGAGGRSFGQDGAVEPGFTVGRPALPPYVRGLLTPYKPVPGPAFSFPDAAPWPVG
jgi:hypothetical protein